MASKCLFLLTYKHVYGTLWVQPCKRPRQFAPLQSGTRCAPQPSSSASGTPRAVLRLNLSSCVAQMILSVENQ